MKYLVKYALGGGFGGIDMEDGEIFEARSLLEAEDYAYEKACEIYESYDGLHGLRTFNMIVEEDGVSEEEAEEIYEDEKETWLEYSAEEIK